MARPILSKKLGNVQLAVWQGDYNGQPTYSYTVKKNRLDKTTNKWENTDFFNKTDLPNVLALLQDAILSGIKTDQPQTQQQPQQSTAQQVQQTFQGQQVQQQPGNPFGGNDQEVPF